MSCGCEVQHHIGDTNITRVKHCPLHAAAPELLTLLERWESGDGTVRGPSPYKHVTELLVTLSRTAIKKARGEA